MAPAALVSYLAMNTQRRPLNDPRIRRAIAHAVRTEALVKLVYQGLGIPEAGFTARFLGDGIQGLRFPAQHRTSGGPAPMW